MKTKRVSKKHINKFVEVVACENCLDAGIVRGIIKDVTRWDFEILAEDAPASYLFSRDEWELT